MNSAHPASRSFPLGASLSDATHWVAVYRELLCAAQDAQCEPFIHRFGRRYEFWESELKQLVQAECPTEAGSSD